MKDAEAHKKERPVYIRIGKVAKITTMAESSIWKRVKDDKKFPRPYPLGGRTTLWDEGEIYKYIENSRLEPGNDTER